MFQSSWTNTVSQPMAGILAHSTSVFLSSLVYKSYIKDIHSNKDNQSWLFVLLRIQAPWIYQILEIWILPILANCTIFKRIQYRDKSPLWNFTFDIRQRNKLCKKYKILSIHWMNYFMRYQWRWHKFSPVQYVDGWITDHINVQMFPSIKLWIRKQKN